MCNVSKVLVVVAAGVFKCKSELFSRMNYQTVLADIFFRSNHFVPVNLAGNGIGNTSFVYLGRLRRNMMMDSPLLVTCT